jgi:hypothetical protein
MAQLWLAPKEEMVPGLSGGRIMLFAVLPT